MSKRQFLLLENTRTVIKAEAELQKLDIKCRVLPVPRALSSECGMCLELVPAVENTILERIAGLPFSSKIAEL